MGEIISFVLLWCVSQDGLDEVVGQPIRDLGEVCLVNFFAFKAKAAFKGPKTRRGSGEVVGQLHRFLLPQDWKLIATIDLCHFLPKATEKLFVSDGDSRASGCIIDLKHSEHGVCERFVAFVLWFRDVLCRLHLVLHLKDMRWCSSASCARHLGFLDRCPGSTCFKYMKGLFIFLRCLFSRWSSHRPTQCSSSCNRCLGGDEAVWLERSD